VGQRKRNRRREAAFRLIASLSAEKILDAQAQLPEELMLIHRSHCMVLFTARCSCQPVFVSQLARV
jgi:hypothetical protein